MLIQSTATTHESIYYRWKSILCCYFLQIDLNLYFSQVFEVFSINSVQFYPFGALNEKVVEDFLVLVKKWINDNNLTQEIFELLIDTLN